MVADRARSLGSRPSCARRNLSVPSKLDSAGDRSARWSGERRRIPRPEAGIGTHREPSGGERVDLVSEHHVIHARYVRVVLLTLRSSAVGAKESQQALTS